MDHIWKGIDANGDCWLWTKARYKNGYGRSSIKGRNVYVHRAVWEALIGSIPPLLEIDHLCRIRHCCNPDHLELVTHQENVRRGKGNQHKHKTHCVQGHEFTEANTYRNAKHPTWRNCRRCVLEAQRKYQERKRNNALS